MVDQCSNCWYGRTPSGTDGLSCTKLAPNAISTNSPASALAQWLLVQPDWWCGDYAGSDPHAYPTASIAGSFPSEEAAAAATIAAAFVSGSAGGHSPFLLNVLDATGGTMVALVDKTSITSLYDSYLFVFDDVSPAGSSDYLTIRVSEDVGVTWDATSGIVDNTVLSNGTGASSTFNYSVTITPQMFHDINGGFHGEMLLTGTTRARPQASGWGGCYDSSGSNLIYVTFVANFTSIWSGASKFINAFKFVYNNGSNFAGGKVSIYGMPKVVA